MVINSYVRDVRKHHVRWMAYNKNEKLTREPAHACEQMEMCVSMQYPLPCVMNLFATRSRSGWKVAHP